MKTKLLSFLLALMLAASLTACGGPSESEDTRSTAAPAETRQTSAQQEDAAQTDGISPLQVQDGQLTTADGSPIQLQGISSHGLSWFPQYVNREMMRQTKEDWGCNVFRLAMYTAEYNGYLTGDEQNRQALKALIDQAVQDAEALGMYLIIDWHTLSDNDPLVNVDEAVAFFSELAEKYGDKTHIIYEICNEPNGSAAWENVKQYAQQVIPAIRKHTDAVILVGTPNWCQSLDQPAADPLDAENLMYTLHFYADTHREDLRNVLQSAIDAKLPVFVSEFGICDASGNGAINEAEADLWLALMNDHQISYVMWNLSNKAESSAAINADCNKTAGLAEEDLSPAGLWFVNRQR